MQLPLTSNRISSQPWITQNLDMTGSYPEESQLIRTPLNNSWDQQTFEANLTDNDNILYLIIFSQFNHFYSLIFCILKSQKMKLYKLNLVLY